MLNPTFPQSVSRTLKSPYVLDAQFADATVSANEAFDTGVEFRLQKVYGNELWKKLDKAGFSPSRMAESDILELCAGTGFLTYHLLRRCSPKSLTVNDIALAEMQSSQALLGSSYPDVKISWVLGDMHEVSFKRRFDIIIGNSFLHHFHDLPKVLACIADMLAEGGEFISLHEPTPMSTVVESAKCLAYPLAVMLPGLVNDFARKRYKGTPSRTDIWMFEPKILKNVALQAGFSRVKLIPWHLLRPMIVQGMGLHLGETKTQLKPGEEMALSSAVAVDAILNQILPARFFGSLCLVCKK